MELLLSALLCCCTVHSNISNFINGCLFSEDNSSLSCFCSIPTLTLDNLFTLSTSDKPRKKKDHPKIQHFWPWGINKYLSFTVGKQAQVFFFSDVTKKSGWGFDQYFSVSQEFRSELLRTAQNCSESDQNCSEPIRTDQNWSEQLRITQNNSYFKNLYY